MQTHILPQDLCHTNPSPSVIKNPTVEKVVQELTMVLAENGNTRGVVSYDDYIDRKKKYMKGQKKPLSPMLKEAYEKARIYTSSAIHAIYFSKAWQHIEQTLLHGKVVRTFEKN